MASTAGRDGEGRPGLTGRFALLVGGATGAGRVVMGTSDRTGPDLLLLEVMEKRCSGWSCRRISVAALPRSG